MIKRAYLVQMSYEVSDAEKVNAEQALIAFEHSLKLLKLASDHLNIMKTPFKNNPEIDPKEIMHIRSALRRFRDKSIENFNRFKEAAFSGVKIMNEFSTDTQVIKLIKSFVSSVEELESKVNNFIDLFSNLEDKEFPNKSVDCIEKIQNQCEEVEEIIDDRIKTHIQRNILATNWIDSVSDELQDKIETKAPLILELFNARQDQLNDIIRERSTLGN